MKNFNEKWVEILTQNQLEKQLEFEAVLESSKGVMFAIMKYRRILRVRGRGGHITVEHLKLGNINEKHLQETLQELFLEPISISHIEYFYKTASKKYDNMIDALEELYRRAMEDRGLRFLSIALTI